MDTTVKIGVSKVIELLDEAINTCPELSYLRKKGKNEHGTALRYHNEKLGAVWVIEEDGKTKYHLYTFYLPDEERDNAIQIEKGKRRSVSYQEDVERKRYLHHGNDEDYKMECDSIEELKNEIERIIKYRSGLDRKI